MRERTGAETILSGFHFVEGPRWHEGALWFSDMHGHRVMRSALDGAAEEVARIDDDHPSGLGWLPDGRLLVVRMASRQLRRVEADGSVVVPAFVSLPFGAPQAANAVSATRRAPLSPCTMSASIHRRTFRGRTVATRGRGGGRPAPRRRAEPQNPGQALQLETAMPDVQAG